MKKTLTILVALIACLALTVPAMAAQPNSGASADTGYYAGSTYEANGWFGGIGGAYSHVAPPVTGTYVGSNIAGSFSSQSVDSSAWGLTFGKVKTTAIGGAFQASGAYVGDGDVLVKNNGKVKLGKNGGSYAFASGGQESGAEYDASSQGFLFDASSGNAITSGGTLVGAYTNGSTSIAGAVTGSYGEANANCDNKLTNVSGQGSVSHATFAQNGTGQAWTSGTADYSYNNTGQGHVSGGGMAATFGASNVTVGPNGGITAHAHSVSVSTNGPVSVSGGTFISSN